MDEAFAPFGVASSTSDEQLWVADFGEASVSAEPAPLPPAPPPVSDELSAILLEGLPAPEEPDEAPYSERVELPPTFVPFERTIASERLGEFCRSVLGYEPVYTGGKGQSLAGMAALRTVLGIADRDGGSLFE
jgi:hypothetical protein